MSYQYRGQTMDKGQSATRRGASSRRDRDRGGRTLLQVFAAAIGLAFLLVGVGGFIPGVTSNYDELTLLGTDSNAKLLGLFRVSVLHNIVHLLFAIGLVAAARASWSKLFLFGGGILYLGVVVYGFVIEESSDANFLPINRADNFLHVGLVVVMIALGLVGVAAARRAES